jgi:outer membrane protein TolC
MRKSVLILFLILVTALLLQAETVTLEQAKSIAIEHNPDLKAQGESYNMSKWSYYSTLSTLFPSGSLSASYSKTDTDNTNAPNQATENGSYGVSFRQPIFSGGKLVTSVSIAKDSRSISAFNLTEKELEILNTTEEKYFNYIKTSKLYTIAEKNMQAAVQRVSDAQVRFSQGTISKAELLKFQADESEKRVALIQAQLAKQTGYVDLKNYLMLDNDFEVEDADSFMISEEIPQLLQLDVDKTTKAITSLKEFCLEHNNTMKSLKLGRNISAKNLYNAKTGFFPTVSLGWSYNRSGDAGDNWADYDGSSTLSLSASLPILPLFDTYSGVARASSEKRKTEYEYLNTENSFKLGIESSYLNLLSKAAQYNASNLSEQYSEETYKQMQERYKNGLISATDLLDAEVVYKSAQVNAVSSKFDYLTTRSGLKKLLGLSSDREIFDIIMQN